MRSLGLDDFDRDLSVRVVIVKPSGVALFLVRPGFTVASIRFIPRNRRVVRLRFGFVGHLYSNLELIISIRT